MRFIPVLLLGFALILWSVPAFADCTDPAAVEGDQTYNLTYKTMMFCDGTNWYSMKGGSGSGGGGGSSVWLNDGPGGPAEIYYNGGNVGIGTNDPAAQLVVNGVSGNKATAIINADDGSNVLDTVVPPLGATMVWPTGWKGGLATWDIMAASALFGGSVGIGDLSGNTGAQLHIVGNALIDSPAGDGSALKIKERGTGYGSKLVWLDDTDAFSAVITKSNTDGLSFFTGGLHNGGDEKLVIGATGNVGIGTDAPSTGLKLDVEGKVGATEYCDENGANCTAAASLGGGGGGSSCSSGTISAALGRISSPCNSGISLATVSLPCAAAVDGEIVQCVSGVQWASFVCNNGTFVQLGLGRGSNASGRCSCFTADAMVAMADGSLKDIHLVEIGDDVLGAGGAVNTVVDIDRTLMWPGKPQHLIRINGGKEFMTDNHPVMTTDGWKALVPDLAEREAYDTLKGQVGLLEIGDVIVMADGKTLPVDSIEIVPHGTENVRLYNLHVGGNHTYYANGFLVHGVVPDSAGLFTMDRHHDGEPESQKRLGAAFQ
jgi:hypothetical protein